jgi:hypothetical protein
MAVVSTTTKIPAHIRVIREMPTSDLIDRYRTWTTTDAQTELEARGVVLWHYALASNETTTMQRIEGVHSR